MFLLEIEMDHLLESSSNIAIGRIQLDQLDSADLSKSRSSNIKHSLIFIDDSLIFLIISHIIPTILLHHPIIINHLLNHTKWKLL